MHCHRAGEKSCLPSLRSSQASREDIGTCFVWPAPSAFRRVSLNPEQDSPPLEPPGRPLHGDTIEGVVMLRKENGGSRAKRGRGDDVSNVFLSHQDVVLQDEGHASPGSGLENVQGADLPWLMLGPRPPHLTAAWSAVHLGSTTGSARSVMAAPESFRKQVGSCSGLKSVRVFASGVSGIQTSRSVESSRTPRSRRSDAAAAHLPCTSRQATECTPTR